MAAPSTVEPSAFSALENYNKQHKKKRKKKKKKILFREGRGKERLGGRRTKKRKNERMEKELKILMEGTLRTKTKVTIAT